MYVTFVRPLLEYASEVWDGCSILNTDKLKVESATICGKNCDWLAYFSIQRIFIF